MIAIVVVTFNRLNLLKEEIISLRNQTYAEKQIIVVNNGSTDGTLEWLSQQKDIITITQDNCGGAGGFFTGIKYAAENGYEFCWIMDDDVDCSSNALDELVKAYNRKPNIGFVCSKVIGIDGCPMNTPIVDERGGENGYADYTDLIEHDMVKVKCATFVSVLIPISVVKQVGLPYREYFIWGDDFEYTCRISSKYESYLACRSSVIHKRSVQKTLTFLEETDKRRLSNYFFKFRNDSYNVIKYGDKGRGRMVFSLFVSAMKLLLQLHISKAMIVLKSAVNLLYFSPKVVMAKN